MLQLQVIELIFQIELRLLQTLILLRHYLVLFLLLLNSLDANLRLDVIIKLIQHLLLIIKELLQIRGRLGRCILRYLLQLRLNLQKLGLHSRDSRIGGLLALLLELLLDLLQLILQVDDLITHLDRVLALQLGYLVLTHLHLHLIPIILYRQRLKRFTLRFVHVLELLHFFLEVLLLFAEVIHV